MTDHQVWPESQEKWVLEVSLVSAVSMDSLDHQGFQERKEIPAQKAMRDLMDLQGPQGFLVTRGQLVPLVQLDRSALLDRLGQEESLVFRAFLALMDYLEIMVILENREQKVTKDLKDTRAPLDFPGLVV